MVQVGSSATTGEKELKRDWPVTEGLTAGTTKQEGTKKHLEADDTVLADRLRVGL